MTHQLPLRLTESEEPTQEAVALNDLAAQVRKAFDLQFLGAEYEYWPIEVYPGFAICRKDGKLFKASYEVTDGQIVFQDGVEEVEAEFVPTGAAQESVIVPGKVRPLPEGDVTESLRDGDEGVPEIYGRLGEAVDEGGWIWRVTIMEAGKTKPHTLPNGSQYVRDYPVEVLTEAVSLFEGLSVFAFSEKEHASSQGAKGVRDEVGFIEDVAVNGNRMEGDLHLYQDAVWLRDRLVGLNESKDLDRMGMSIDASGDGAWLQETNPAVYLVSKLVQASSVDVVHSPFHND